jgi:hypothetical protein
MSSAQGASCHANESQIHVRSLDENYRTVRMLHSLKAKRVIERRSQFPTHPCSRAWRAFSQRKGPINRTHPENFRSDWTVRAPPTTA